MNSRTNLVATFLLLLLVQSFEVSYGIRLSPRVPNRRRRDNGLELLHVNLVWRHGARSPHFGFQTDPNKDYEWDQEGKSQLTKIGMLQQFELGTFLRHRYGNFLSPAYKREEIYVRSSDRDRTLMSALCNMAGMYKPNGSQVWNEQISWQPVPIHTIDIKDDVLLYVPYFQTPSYLKLVEKVRQGPEYKRIASESQDFLAEVKRLTQFPRNLSLFDAYVVRDPLKCAEVEGLQLPKWYNKEFKGKLHELATYGFATIFGPNTPQQNELLKVHQGHLVKQMLQNFDNSINQTVPYKVIAYSGHDTTLISLLVAFGNYRVLPPFAACLMFELYKDPSAAGEKQYIVKTFYRTTPNERPRQLDLLGCGLNCPLAELKRLSVPFLPDDE